MSILKSDHLNFKEVFFLVLLKLKKIQLAELFNNFYNFFELIDGLKSNIFNFFVTIYIYILFFLLLIN